MDTEETVTGLILNEIQMWNKSACKSDTSLKIYPPWNGKFVVSTSQMVWTDTETAMTIRATLYLIMLQLQTTVYFLYFYVCDQYRDRFTD